MRPYSLRQVALYHVLPFALVFWLASAAVAAPAGIVVGLSGPCFVESGASRSVLAIGQPIRVGETVDVPASSKMKLRLGDGTIVSIAAGTKLTITGFTIDASGHRQDIRLSLGAGLLRAVVAPVLRPAIFEIDTAVGSALARSTDWFIEAGSWGMEVGVLTGLIELTGATIRPSVTIPAGWGTRLAVSSGSIAPPAPGGPRGLSPSGQPSFIRRQWSLAEFSEKIARTAVDR